MGNEVSTRLFSVDAVAISIRELWAKFNDLYRLTAKTLQHIADFLESSHEITKQVQAHIHI